VKRLAALLASALAIALGTTAVAYGAPGQPSAGTDQPSAKTDQPNVNIGDPVLIDGSGWPGHTLVYLQVCGNNALNGSIDCALESGVNAGVGADGSFSMTVRVSRPPSPCPCVVYVSDPSSVGAAVVPINVSGVASSPGSLQTTPQIYQVLRVTGVHFKGHTPWLMWFGAGATRTIVFTVTNVGDVVVSQAQMSLAFGKGRNPTGFVNAPTMSSLRPGQKVTFTAHVPINQLSFGVYTFTGEIAGFGKPLEFRRGFSIYPWALMICVLLIPVIFVLWRRTRARRRARRADPGELAVSAAALEEVASQNGAVAATSADTTVEAEALEGHPATVAELEARATALAERAAELAAVAGRAVAEAEEAARKAEAAHVSVEEARQREQATTPTGDLDGNGRPLSPSTRA
jgi:hypothetical protein